MTRCLDRSNLPPAESVVNAWAFGVLGQVGPSWWVRAVRAPSAQAMSAVALPELERC